MTPPAQTSRPLDQQLAIAHWLLSAAPDAVQALAEWREYGVAALRCDALFSAVRIPAPIVHAAVASEDPATVGASLAEALDGGGVFYDARFDHYYALTPVSTVNRWREPQTECLGGPGVLLGVPQIANVGPDDGLTYWSVPMNGPGALCQPVRLAAIADIGRARLAAPDSPGGAS